MSEAPTIDERLASAREAKAARDAARAERDKARELLVLDLEARFEAEIGPRGDAFQIIEFAQVDKVVAVKRAAGAVTKRFNDCNRGKRSATDEEFRQYVLPCVIFPEKDEARLLFATYDQMAGEVALDLRDLEAARIREKMGKQ